ncbi:nucleotidyltransferase family protein [Thermomonas sp.]|uniref:nucleotidyltransferase family protein n=1 Tax=Thermomonas sp. TaxID=1971895 RepID=UPI00262A2947|nr:nucleotidyltransferase family protein [Thermomonas sp.]MCO5054633.1 nucleotidyltransferase family protein [Thermomonas sp.]
MNAPAADFAALRALCADCLRETVLPARWEALAAAGEPALDVAQAQGVTALLAAAVAKVLPAYPELTELHAALSVRNKREAMQEMQRGLIAREAIAALAEGDVRVLVLKGTALAHWLYPQPWQRLGCDVDLLVPELAAAETAVDCLQARDFMLQTSVRPAQTAGFEAALEKRGRRGFAVDLHWRIANRAQLAKALTFDELWAASIPLPDLHPAARGLGPLHALLHALLHRVTNFPTGEHDRLIWLFDIHLLARSLDAAQWQTLLALCARRAIATPCLDGLEASRLAFATAIPDAALQSLRAAAAQEHWQLGSTLDQAAMDRAHLAALPWRGKLGWLRRKLFPSPEFMRYRYSISGTSAALVRAYLTRWVTGVVRLFKRG